MSAEREPQCAYRKVGVSIHHRIPGCGMTWRWFEYLVWSGKIEVLTDEPTDSKRCSRCYSEASYREHPL